MIPVSLPGGNFYVSLVVSLVCLSTLLTWLTRLAIDRRARSWLRSHRRLGPALMAALAVLGGIFPYQNIGPWMAAQREARAEKERRLVLDQARELAGVDMPAGTALKLDAPGDAASFVQADFPTTVKVAGIPARQLFRHLRPASGAEPARETWSLALDNDQPVQDGWRCSRGHRIELRVEQGKPGFDSCHLAAGNLLNGQPLPTGTWLDQRQARPARWLLRTEGSDPVTVAGLDLLKADIVVDEHTKLVSFEGLLAHEFTLGELTYPAGTRAGSADKVPGAQRGDLIFSPPRGRAALRAGKDDVPSGHSVLQAPGGAVRNVLTNHEAGVLDVANMRIGP